MVMFLILCFILLVGLITLLYLTWKLLKFLFTRLSHYNQQ